MKKFAIAAGLALASASVIASAQGMNPAGAAPMASPDAGATVADPAGTTSVTTTSGSGSVGPVEATGTGVATASAAGTNASYPLCSRTVKDSCRQRR